MSAARRLACAALLLVVGGCGFAPAAAGRTMVATQLYCGLAKPGGGAVGTEEFDAFLRGFVTERFPDGLTVLSGRGQWRDTRTREVVVEDSRVLVLVHDGGSDAQKKVREVADEYKRRFAQQAVLRVDAVVGVTLDG